MNQRSKMGAVLNVIRGNDTPIELMARLKDFNVVNVKGPNGEVGRVPAESLVAFAATSFSEVYDNDGQPTDVWQFRVMEDTPAGRTAFNIYLSGEDIFLVKQMSKVI